MIHVRPRRVGTGHTHRAVTRASVDTNVIMLADGGLVETQATAEKNSYTRTELNGLLHLAEDGIRTLFVHQQAAITTATTA